MDISKRNAHWILWGILLLGMMLRVWGLDFGLPALSRPDENHISQAALNTIFASFASGSPSLDPHFFYYPSLYVYAVSALYGVYYLLGYWAGAFADTQAFLALYFNDWTSFHLIQRALSALCGILTIPALYALGKQVGQTRLIGLGCALLLAVTYLHVRDSHFGTTDISATLWVTLALYHACRYARLNTGSYANLYRAAAFAGLAAGTKYPAGLVIISLYVILGFTLKRSGACPKRALTPVVNLTLIALGFFLCSSPYLLLDPMAALSNIMSQAQTMGSDFYHYLDPGWLYHLRFSIPYGLGVGYGALAVLGMMLGVFKDKAQRPLHLALMAFVAVYYIANGPTHYVFVRYILPLVPVLALYAVLGAENLAHFLSRILECKIHVSHDKIAIILTSVLLIFASADSFARSFSLDQVLSQSDTRAQARRWLTSRLKPGDGVGIGMVFTHIDLPQSYKRYFLFPPRRGLDYAKHRADFYFEPKARLMENSTNRNEYNLSTYSDVATLRQLGIRYVVLGQVSLDAYRLPQFEIDAVHQAAQKDGLKKVAEFFPGNQSSFLPPQEEYDRIDGFFVPFTHPNLVRRPGPHIEIFAVTRPE